MRKIYEYLYAWVHRRELEKNARLAARLLRQHLLLTQQHQYIQHLRDEMKKLFRVPSIKADPETTVRDITEIGCETLELRINQCWSMMMPHDFDILAVDIRQEWARTAAQSAVEGLEEKLAQEIFKQIA